MNKSIILIIFALLHALSSFASKEDKVLWDSDIEYINDSVYPLVKHKKGQMLYVNGDTFRGFACCYWYGPNPTAMIRKGQFINSEFSKKLLAISYEGMEGRADGSVSITYKINIYKPRGEMIKTVRKIVCIYRYLMPQDDWIRTEVQVTEE